MREETLRLFEEIVGKENVVTDDHELSLAERTNYTTTEKIKAIVNPADVSELSKCVEVAQQHGIAIHPFSKGKNWGYGSRVPLIDNALLINLSRLNNILEYDEQLAYVTIEPGVTFGQLFDFLREKKSGLILSTTGGGEDSSVIANALERGIGTGLYAERFANVCGLEVVLPQGQIIKTGMGRFGENVSSNLYKWGMGPSLDGLFSQSNFGIVTKMTIWLMKCPEHFRLLFYKINTNEKLTEVIDTVQDLCMQGVVRPAVTIYNDFRTISTMVQYPWGQCTPGKDTAATVIDTLKSNIPPTRIVSKWNGEISIRASSKEHADVQLKLIEDAIKNKVDEWVAVDVSKDEIMLLLEKHWRQKNIPHDTDIIKSFLVRKYIGIPDGTALRQTYWRKKTPVPVDMDPDRDKCGLIWICPVVPFRGSDIQNAISITTNIIEKHGFEPAISLQCLSERAINIIASISWDREVAGEDEKAEACYIELNHSLNEQGYFSYRNTTKGMKLKAPDIEDPYNELLDNIKRAIDPQNILSKGRYNING